jgi:hypothetical protein
MPHGANSVLNPTFPFRVRPDVSKESNEIKKALSSPSLASFTNPGYKSPSALWAESNSFPKFEQPTRSVSWVPPSVPTASSSVPKRVHSMLAPVAPKSEFTIPEKYADDPASRRLFQLVRQSETYSNQIQEILRGWTNLSEREKNLRNKGIDIETQPGQSDLIRQPALLKHQLRSYQLVGLNWLYLLFQRNINGILADESNHKPFSNNLTLFCFSF